MSKKIIAILRESSPVILMIVLIPVVTNDVLLTLTYVGMITLLLTLRKEKNDILVLCVGFVTMTIFESLFITTGVEVFLRNSLFGYMPLWLTFLWAYGFVVIKKSLRVIEK